MCVGAAGGGELAQFPDSVWTRYLAIFARLARSFDRATLKAFRYAPLD